MPKKPVVLEGLLTTESRAGEAGTPQRGTEPILPAKKPPSKKRITLALDGASYRRLRIYAAETDQTHQAILESALAEYLNRAITQTAPAARGS